MFQFFKTESPIFTFESILRIYDYLVSDYYYSDLMFAPCHRPPADVQSYELHVFSFYCQLLFDSGRWLAQAAGWLTGSSTCWLVGRRFGRLVNSGGWLVD